MTWTAVLPSGSKPGRGAHSPAIRAGDFIFTSGHIPVDPETGAVLGNDVASQTVAVIDRLEAVLAEAGATLRDVVSVSAFLSDMKDWDAFNTAYGQRFPTPYPTRTTVGGQLHGVLVEITVVAYVGD